MNLNLDADETTSDRTAQKPLPSIDETSISYNEKDIGISVPQQESRICNSRKTRQ